MLPRARPHPFPGTRRRALLVAGLLALHVVAAWLALQAVFVFVELAWRAVAGRGDYGALVAAHLAQFAALRTAQAVLWIVTAAAFVRWTRAAHGNLAALGATGLGYAAPDVPTVFLRPGLALRRPPGLLREIWNASDPRLPGGDAWR
ncbi:MAG TPA: DUF4328 domain-containing protein, partial [Candidatus Tectomicrobia bacterium]|nr:DUF4328 domain-containing protein [Candidatus Tectomicrobia bacterium]